MNECLPRNRWMHKVVETRKDLRIGERVPALNVFGHIAEDCALGNR